MSEQHSKLQSLATIANIIVASIAVLTTMLLLAGYTYRVGYLGAFGLGVDSIPMDFSENIGEAYYMSLLFLVEITERIWWPFIAILILALLAAAVFIVIILGVAGKLGNTLEKWLGDLKSGKPSRSLWLKGIALIHEDIIEGLGTKVLAIMLPLGLVVLTMTKSYQEGSTAGNDQHQDFSEIDYECARLPEKRLNCVQVVQLSDGQLMAEGLNIMGSSKTHLAIYDGASAHVFQRSSDLKLVIITGSIPKNGSD